MTKDQAVKAAEEIAQKYAQRLVASYKQSVSNYFESYTDLPDDDDFFAWVESYEWSDSE